MGCRPERVFAALALLFGTAFALVSPPLDPADERTHLTRAFLVSEGQLLAPGSNPGHRAAVPRSLLELHVLSAELGVQNPGLHPFKHHPADLWALFARPLVPAQRLAVPVSTSYSPLVYAPAAAGVLLGRAFGVPPMGLLALARLANLLSWIAGCALAIRLLPFRRWTLVALCLTPMPLYLASSVSADAPTHAVALLMLALALRASYATGVRVAGREVGFLVGTAALLGLVKPGYWILAALVAFIPADRFSSRRARIGVVAAAGVSVLACAGLWQLTLSISGARLAYGASDPVANFNSIFAEPLRFASILANTVVLRWWWYVQGFVGQLGHTEVILPSGLYVAYPVLLVGVALSDGEAPRGFGLAARMALLALFAASIAFLLTAAYVGWHHPGWSIILPVQGRYFTPIAPLLLLALPGFAPLPRRTGPAVIAGGCALGLACAVYAVASHYLAW